MIINITGQAGAGKTTIANRLANSVKNPIVIDGDELRDLFKNKDYSEDGRRRNITNAYNIARFLEAKGYTPIIALISPYLDLREELKSQTEVVEVYVRTDQIRGREQFFAQNYESPQDNFLFVDTSNPIDACLREIKMYIINNAKY
jgi:adenylylsulfate kinase-like enzyme